MTITLSTRMLSAPSRAKRRIVAGVHTGQFQTQATGREHRPEHGADAHEHQVVRHAGGEGHHRLDLFVAVHAAHGPDGIAQSAMLIRVVSICTVVMQSRIARAALQMFAFN